MKKSMTKNKTVKRAVALCILAVLLILGIYIYYRDATRTLDFTVPAESVNFETLPKSIVETPIPKNRTDGKLCFVTLAEYSEKCDETSDFCVPKFSVWNYGEKASDYTSETVKIKGYKRVYFFDVTADDKLLFVAKSNSDEFHFAAVKDGKVIFCKKLKTPPAEMRAYLNDVLFLEKTKNGYVLNLINLDSGDRKEIVRFKGESYDYRVEGSKLLYETNIEEAAEDKTKSKIAIYENGEVSSYLPKNKDLFVGFADDSSVIYFKDFPIWFSLIRSGGFFYKYNLFAKLKTYKQFTIYDSYLPHLEVSFLLSKDGRFAMMDTVTEVGYTFGVDLKTGKSLKLSPTTSLDYVSIY